MASIPATRTNRVTMNSRGKLSAWLNEAKLQQHRIKKISE